MLVTSTTDCLLYNYPSLYFYTNIFVLCPSRLSNKKLNTVAHICNLSTQKAYKETLTQTTKIKNNVEMI